MATRASKPPNGIKVHKIMKFFLAPSTKLYSKIWFMIFFLEQKNMAGEILKKGANDVKF